MFPLGINYASLVMIGIWASCLIIFDWENLTAVHAYVCACTCVWVRAKEEERQKEWQRDSSMSGMCSRIFWQKYKRILTWHYNGFKKCMIWQRSSLLGLYIMICSIKKCQLLISGLFFYAYLKKLLVFERNKLHDKPKPPDAGFAMSMGQNISKSKSVSPIRTWVLIWCSKYSWQVRLPLLLWLVLLGVLSSHARKCRGLRAFLVPFWTPDACQC